MLRLEQRISELAAGNAGSGQKDDGHNGTGADTGRNPGNIREMCIRDSLKGLPEFERVGGYYMLGEELSEQGYHASYVLSLIHI